MFAGVVYPQTGMVRSLAAKTARGQLFVVPDNGILTLVLDAEDVIETREVENPDAMNTPASPSFYGRDIVVACAAHLAAGFPLQDVGRPVSSLERFTYEVARTDASGRVLGEVSCVDKNYGNVWTNIHQRLASSAGLTTGVRLHVRLNGDSLELPLARTFSDVPIGRPLAYFNSRGRLPSASIREVSPDAWARWMEYRSRSSDSVRRRSEARTAGDFVTASGNWKTPSLRPTRSRRAQGRRDERARCTCEEIVNRIRKRGCRVPIAAVHCG